jgi:hypothetical protein
MPQLQQLPRPDGGRRGLNALPGALRRMAARSPLLKPMAGAGRSGYLPHGHIRS